MGRRCTGDVNQDGGLRGRWAGATTNTPRKKVHQGCTPIHVALKPKARRCNKGKMSQTQRWITEFVLSHNVDELVDDLITNSFHPSK